MPDLPPPPRDRAAYRFFEPFRVRYAEVDRQGVAYQANHLVWIDQAIWEYVRALPWDMDAHLRDTGADFHTVRNVIEYHAPIPFDAEIAVGVRVARTGRSSLTFAAAIFLKDGGDARTTGEVVWVNADQTTHRSAPLPAPMVARIAAAEAGPDARA